MSDDTRPDGPVLHPIDPIDPRPSQHVGVGYSDKYDLQQAIGDAILDLRKREADPLPHPPIITPTDQLYYYRVSEIGVMIGGIAGFNRLRVAVERASLPTIG